MPYKRMRVGDFRDLELPEPSDDEPSAVTSARKLKNSPHPDGMILAVHVDVVDLLGEVVIAVGGNGRKANDEAPPEEATEE